MPIDKIYASALQSRASAEFSAHFPLCPLRLYSFLKRQERAALAFVIRKQLRSITTSALFFIL